MRAKVLAPVISGKLNACISLKILNDEKKGLVFLLWGAHAQRKGEMINPGKHVILACAHPSPFSANRGFFGCKPFSKTNAILKANGQTEIDWQLPA